MLFRVFTSMVLVLTGAITTSAQDPGTDPRDVVFFNHALPMPFGAIGPDNALEKVKEALSLSDVQVTAVQTLLNMRKESIRQIAEEAEAAHRQLRELLGQTNPSPMDVGMAFLASRAIQQRFQAAAEKFQSDFDALLSPQQRSTLAGLKAASSQIQALTALGLIDGGFGSMPFMKFLPFEAGAAGAGVRAAAPMIQRAIRIQRPAPANP
jgi:uncharacterized membrane protein